MNIITCKLINAYRIPSGAQREKSIRGHMLPRHYCQYRIERANRTHRARGVTADADNALFRAARRPIASRSRNRFRTRSAGRHEGSFRHDYCDRGEVSRPIMRSGSAQHGQPNIGDRSGLSPDDGAVGASVPL